MKKYLPLLFFLVSLQSFSQTDFRFADSTAQWNVLETQYYFVPVISWSTMVFSVEGDTTFDNHSYQIIKYNVPILPLEPSGRYYLRQDSTEKVFGRVNRDSSEYLVYDFGKQPGDTFSIGLPQTLLSSIRIKVDSVSSVFWGRSRKVMYVTVESIGTFNDAFVEGVGSLHTFPFYPGIDQSFLDGPGYSLLCYFENDTALYHDSLYNTCLFDSLWMGMVELPSSHVNISPNPTSSSITIQSEDNFSSNTSFQLFDLTGRMVLQKQIADKTSRMELNEVSKGMYLYHVSSGGRRIASGKLVIE